MKHFSIKTGLILIGLEALIACSTLPSSKQFTPRVSPYTYIGNNEEQRIARDMIEEVIDFRFNSHKRRGDGLTKEDVSWQVYKEADLKSPFFYITLEEARKLHEQEFQKGRYAQN